jgi:MFS family permease
MLALLALAELLGISLWLAGSAVAPQLTDVWSLSTSEVGWLSTAVQLGFVAGTGIAAVLNLADTLPSRLYFAAAAVLGAAANAAFAFAPDYQVGVILRFLTGACLAGVYPPAMKMISTWFESGRGLAIGTIVGALTAGKALPYLIHAVPNVGAVPVVLSASLAALVAALLVLVGYRDGPYPFPRRPFSWSLAHTVLRSREYRLVLGGYSGHMIELYSYWVWIPSFLEASVANQSVSAPVVSLLAFGAIAVGAIGCVWGGAAADRIGHARLIIWAMAISGTCAILTPFVFGRSLLLLGALVLVWGTAVIADSAQFSTLITRSVPIHAVGTALTLQTSIGFLLTTISIQLVPPAVDLVGWKYAFPMLAAGPALGIVAMRRVRPPAPG